MSRIYSVAFSGDIAAADTDVDLVEILPADDKPCKLVGFVLGQISEIKEAEEEGIRVSVIRLPATVTSGSGGSAATPAPMDSADVAAGFAAETKNTTVATTSGTAVTLDEMGWNLRGAPVERWWPDPQLRPKVKQGEGLVVRWQTTVIDTVTMQFTAYIEEE
jgi:hypothetical protein